MSNAPEIPTKPHWKTGDDLTGTTCGWLQVVEQVPRPADASVKFRGTWWRCRCRCGNEKIVPRQYIVQKNVTSCGCKIKKKTGEEPEAQTDKPVRRKQRRNNPPGLAKSYETLATPCKCPACGKRFERLSSDWVYRASVNGRTRWFCSWKCLRKATEKKQRIQKG